METELKNKGAHAQNLTSTQCLSFKMRSKWKINLLWVNPRLCKCFLSAYICRHEIRYQLSLLSVQDTQEFKEKKNKKKLIIPVHWWWKSAALALLNQLKTATAIHNCIPSANFISKKLKAFLKGHGVLIFRVTTHKLDISWNSLTCTKKKSTGTLSDKSPLKDSKMWQNIKAWWH